MSKFYLQKHWLPLLFLLIAVLVLVVTQWSRPPATVVVISAIIKERPVVGQALKLPIMVKTGPAAINAAEVQLTFDTTKVRIESVSTEGSMLRFWVPGQPTFSNEKGTVSFIGGLPNPGFTGEGKIGSVVVTPLSAGQQTISFKTTTQALLNDGFGTAVPLITKPITLITYPQ